MRLVPPLHVVVPQVYIHSGPEMSVASTKAFSNMVAARPVCITSCRVRHMSIHEGQQFAGDHCPPFRIKLRIFQNERRMVPPHISEALDKVTRWVSESKCTIFLGRGVSSQGFGRCTDDEVAYIPCIAYPSGELKHGPIALIEDGTPVIVIVSNDHLKEKTLLICKNVKRVVPRFV